MGKKNHKRKLGILTLVTGFSLLLLAGGAITYYFRHESAVVATSEKVPPTQRQSLETLAQAITVKIITKEGGGGSGVIIKKEDQTYTVATNHHVVGNEAEMISLITPDGKTHQATLTNLDFQENDLAVLEFESESDYKVASLGNLENIKTGQPVISGGFPFEDKTSDQRTFAARTGYLSLILPQPLKGGYQIGYTSEVEKGMSGGPILTLEGKVIGVNGIHSHPLWGNPYIYQDESSPSDFLRQRLERSSWGVPLELVAQIAPKLIPSLSVSSTETLKESTEQLAEKIDKIANEVAVKVSWQDGNGSGVIIGKKGNTYQVLTAEHVASGNRTFTLITADGRKHSIKPKIRTWQGVDLALLEFTSDVDYKIVTLGNYSVGSQDRVVFVTGWPDTRKTQDRTGRKFSVGFLLAGNTATDLATEQRSILRGRELLYTNVTETGMSGGPVFDTEGRLIGIHAAAEGVKGNQPNPVPESPREQRQLDIGYSLGVPIRIFLALMEKEQPFVDGTIVRTPPQKLSPPQQDRIVKTSLALNDPSAGADAIDWLNYGNKLWRLRRYQEAQTAFEKAIALQPNFYEAWYAHGLTLSYQGEYEKAISSYQKVTELESTTKNPRLYDFAFYADRQIAWCFSQLGNLKESLAALDRAIKRRPDDFILYYRQAELLSLSGRLVEALEASNKAIKFSQGKHPLSFLKRAELYNGFLQGFLSLVNSSKANADYTKAIELQPTSGNAYALRGLHRARFENYVGAVNDINEAIRLNPDNGLFYAQKGLIYAMIGHQKEFQDNFKQAIRLEPDNPDIFMLRGEARATLAEKQKETQEPPLDDYSLDAINEDYLEAIRLAPERVAEIYLARSAAVSTLDQEQALRDVNQAIEEAPALSQIALFEAYRGATYHIKGEPEKAEHSWAKANKLDPHNALIEFFQIVAYVGVNDLPKALDITNQAIQKYPDVPSFYEAKALIGFGIDEKKGDKAGYSQSIDALTKAIEVSKYDKAFYYQDRATFHKFQGNDEAALADLNEAIQEQPSNASLYNLRGTNYYNQKKYGLAIADYTKAIDIEPDQAQFHENRSNAKYKQNGDKHTYSSRIDYYHQQIIETTGKRIIDPNNDEYREQLINHQVRLAVLYAAEKKDAEAKEVNNQVIALSPSDAVLVKIYSDLFGFANQENDNQLKIIVLKKLIELEPDNAEHYRQLGLAYYALKDYQNSFPAFTKSLEIDPAQEDLIGGFAILKNDKKLRIAVYQKLTEVDPNNAEYYNQLGLAYYALKQDEKAVQAYTQAIELNTTNKYLYLGNRADAYNRLGEHEKYLADNRQARKANSDNITKMNLKILQVIP